MLRFLLQAEPSACLCKQQHILGVEARIDLLGGDKVLVRLLKGRCGRRSKDGGRNLLFQPGELGDLVAPEKNYMLDVLRRVNYRPGRHAYRL